MIVKKGSLLMLFIFITGIAFSQTADKQYLKTFGNGAVVASGKGVPLKDKFDKSQIDFKNNIFYVKGGPGATISLLVFVKDGKTFGDFLDKKKKEYDPKIVIEGSERIVMQIWTSHGINGQIERPEKSVWPTKLGDTPEWSDFGMMKYDPVPMLNKTEDPSTWADLNPTDTDSYSGGSLEKWLTNAKPGYRIYIQFYNSIVINYEWDTYKQQWKTMLCKGEPVSACTIEIK